MLDIKPPEPCGDLMELPDLSVPITVDTESLVQPNRRFTPLDAAAELEGFLNVSSRPRISAGYADIYHGIWTSPQGERIEVAVKEFRALIPRDRQSDPGVLRRRTEIRMQREVFVWSQIKHPNLHPLLGYRLQPKPRLISPWCPHGNLIDYLRGRPGLTRLGKIRLHVALAISTRNPPPICHADIKPENILINAWLEAVLSDFGLSLVLEELGVPSGLTTSERVKGTLNYMAGELFLGAKPTRESDVYAFGGLILTVMSGKPPFAGLREPNIILRVTQGDPPKPEDHPNLPPSDPLWALMHRCWHKNPEFRPTMQEILGRLSEEPGSVPSIEVQPTSTAPPKLALSVEDKAKVKSAIPQDSAKIISALLVTMQNAHPDPSKWAYTGQEGALVLIVDKINGGFWFKIVDLKGTRGVTWEHQLSDDFTYYRDRATFHSFAGETYMIGFAFTKEEDANIFFKKVIGRAKYAPPTPSAIPPTGSGVNTTSTVIRATSTALIRPAYNVLARAISNALVRSTSNDGIPKVNSGRIATLANVAVEGLRRHAQRLRNWLFGHPQVATDAHLDVFQAETYVYAPVSLSAPWETREVVAADDRVRTLVACTIIVSITQGLGWGFAVFPPFFKQNILSQTMFDSRIVLLPGTQVAAMMLTSGFSGRFGDRYGHKLVIVLGCFASVASVFGCAFGKHLWHFYATQAIQGIGAGLVYPPCISIVGYSWKERSYPASSFLLACIPLYGFVAVLCSQALLTVVGQQKMLLIFSGIHSFFLFSTLLALYNTRNPPRSSSITWLVKEQIFDPRFWFLALSITFTGFATLQPFVFLTTFTVNTVPGISPMLAVLPLALVNLTGVFGRSIATFLINSFTPSFPKPVVKSRHAFAGAILLAALSQLIGAFAKSYGHIVAYACVNGLFGTTFLSILLVLSTNTFPKVNKTATVDSLVIFSAPGFFFGALVFNTLMHRLGSWMISLLTISGFQLIGAILALFGTPHVDLE